jgi:hypothetical protein|tara:strand:+ start:386 stop:568 length:183 start_codon:yes stop_codon:yes gene_type:complete
MRRYYKSKGCGCSSCGTKNYKKGGTVKDSCYRKVKASYKVFPSAYASGAIAKCRKKKAGK